jgi:hypothetical protein
LAGVPRHSDSVPLGRRLAWGVTVTGGVLYFYFAALIFLLFWPLALLCLVALVGSLIWLLVTGPRDRRGVERFVFSSAGVARLPLVHEPGLKLDTAFEPWTGEEAVELRRISGVWRRLRIDRRRGARGGHGGTIFDAGVRCPDAVAPGITSALERYIGKRAPALRKAPPTSPAR